MPDTMVKLEADDREHKTKDISRRKGLKKNPERRVPKVVEKRQLKESTEDEPVHTDPEPEAPPTHEDLMDPSTGDDQLFGPNIRGLGDPNAWPELDSPKAALALGNPKSTSRINKGISFTFGRPRVYRRSPELYLSNPSVNTASVNAGDSALYVGGSGINRGFEKTAHANPQTDRGVPGRHTLVYIRTC